MVGGAEQAENTLAATRSMWSARRRQKWRDAPLAEVATAKLRRRARLGMADPDGVAARIERVCLRIR